MPYLREEACEEREESKGEREGLHSVWFPISTLFQVFSHLMPVKVCEETEYVVAMTGVPLLAE